MRKNESILVFTVLALQILGVWTAPPCLAQITPVSPAVGGGGLCSTVTDYWRFAQMLLNRGTFQGRRILKPDTVDLMTRDHVATVKKDGGFGLGVSVRRKSVEQGAGTFGWGGFWYTTFFVDPEQQLIGIAMGQLHPSGGATLNGEFEGMVRKALVE